MAWQDELTFITRTLINDFDNPYTYSDSRIEQVLVVASKYVQLDITTSHTYNIDVSNFDISPDPTLLKDNTFTGLVCLKAACIIDQSTFRTKAAREGSVKTVLGPASIDVTNNLSGYKTILEIGPCKLYEQLCLEYNIGNASIVQAVLSPFVGNNFDPHSLLRGSYRNRGDLYS